MRTLLKKSGIFSIWIFIGQNVRSLLNTNTTPAHTFKQNAVFNMDGCQTSILSLSLTTGGAAKCSASTRKTSLGPFESDLINS